MIKFFKTYLYENQYIEEIPLDSLSINAYDYIECWECLLKDRYRNTSNGDLKRLHEIFEIPIHHKDKYIGLFDKEDKFHVLNLKASDVIYEKLRFIKVDSKKEPQYDIYIGHSKYRVNKNSIIVCRLSDYLFDLRVNFKNRIIFSEEAPENSFLFDADTSIMITSNYISFNNQSNYFDLFGSLKSKPLIRKLNRSVDPFDEENWD